jgi:hypothetical protein
LIDDVQSSINIVIGIPSNNQAYQPQQVDNSQAVSSGRPQTVYHDGVLYKWDAERQTWTQIASDASRVADKSKSNGPDGIDGLFGRETPGSTVTVQRDGDLVRVGRWMSRAEYDAMVASGMVQEGAGGRTYVASPADPAAYGREAAPGTGYVEFDVPRHSLYPAGKQGWAQIPGPNSLQGRLARRRGQDLPQLPPALDIQWLLEK